MHILRGVRQQQDEPGRFSICSRQAAVVQRHGHAFNDLDLGKREPVTEEEKLFVAVCRGEREPVTDAERVWSKYMTRIKRPKRFHTLSGGKPQVEGAEDYTEADD
nr:DUF413 domain-containing protein [Salmonella sp. S143_60131]